MKIRVGLITNDANYIKRVCAYFNENYSQDMEIKGFLTLEDAQEYMQTLTLDIWLVDQLYQNEMYIFRNVCAVILADSNDVQKIGEYTAIGKYQKAEALYRNILEAHQSLGNVSYQMKSGVQNHNCHTVFFTCGAGGAGTSTAAYNYAVSKQREGKQVFYLDLNTDSSLSCFLKGDDNISFSRVLFAVKNGCNDMLLKSYIQTDISGLSFFSQAKELLDVLDMNLNDVSTMITMLVNLNLFDEIVIDYNNHYNDIHLWLLQNINQVMLLQSDRESVKHKNTRMLEALAKLHIDIASTFTNYQAN